MLRNKKIYLLVCLVIAIPFIWWGISYYITYKKPNVAEEAVVYIHKDAGFQAVMDSLEASGAVRNMRSMKRYFSKVELEKHFEAGRYRLKPRMNNQYISRMIANRWEEPVAVRLRGYTKTLESLAGFFGRQFMADSAAFISTFTDEALIDSLGFKKETFIGMFIPNTYNIYWTSTPEQVVSRFYAEYDKFWKGERDALAKEAGLTRMEVMTLASIVIGETATVSEMPKIAGVYMNRLRKKMPLQACPTIIYAHKDIEPGITRVLNRHLEINSPYNTYKRRGLPPGPIAIPTIAAIDAVLHYEHSKYLYFCAKPEFDGTHNFATNYSEHRANSRAYNKALKELQSKSK